MRAVDGMRLLLMIIIWLVIGLAAALWAGVPPDRKRATGTGRDAAGRT